MKLTAKIAGWVHAPGGGVMILNEEGHNMGVFALQASTGLDAEYVKKLNDAVVESFNAAEVDIDLPARIM